MTLLFASLVITIVALALPLSLWALIRLAQQPPSQESERSGRLTINVFFLPARPFHRVLVFIWLGGAVTLDMLQFLIPIYTPGTGIPLYLSLGFAICATALGLPVGLLLIWTTRGVSSMRKTGFSAALTPLCLGYCAGLGPLWLIFHLAP